jgi:adenosylmethionine-8-amino-7-oxononanoate aminotransferase
MLALLRQRGSRVWRALPLHRTVRTRALASTATPNKSSVSPAHWDASWDKDKLHEEAKEHVMATWGPGSAIRKSPILARGEGVYVFDIEGNQYLDWTSQAVCVNLGYTVPENVKKALARQVETLPFVYSGFGVTEPRVRLASLISELLPGDLTGCLFPTSGAEANEAAVRMARRFTGKTKIINQYRSYHGGTSSSLAATGDFRRNFVEGKGSDGPAGFIKTMNPTDSHLFSFGETDAERTAKALGFLEEQILCEGPHTIAAIMLESITGSAGVFMNPPGYMKGVRELCDKYGILLISDEVMVGFARTGKFWAFQHYDGVLPDIVTSAKGLTGAWMSLSMVAVRQEIKDFFETNPLGWGSTFHAHPNSCAVGYECVKYMLEIDLASHVQNNLAPVMRAGVEGLAAKFDSVGKARAVGCFGAVDLLDPRTGLPIQQFSGANCSHPEAVATFKAKLLENGMFGFVRPPIFHCAPPLVATPEELKEGFARAERAMEAYDRSFRA